MVVTAKFEMTAEEFTAFQAWLKARREEAEYQEMKRKVQIEYYKLLAEAREKETW